jgi:protein disulfide-isomerase
MNFRSTVFGILLISFALSGYSQTSAVESESLKWHTDVAEAYALSKTVDKPIFAFFTGSDWCGWCHKLQKDVFSKPSFVNWAKENVVLLELDFPRRKELPQQLVQQNQSLQQFFKVTGFPTIWLFSMTEEVATKKFLISGYGSLGYPRQPEIGKEEIQFLNDANRILKKKAAK